MLMEDDRNGYVGYLFEIAADIAYCYDEMNNPEKYGLSGNESKHDYYNRLLRIRERRSYLILQRLKMPLKNTLEYGADMLMMMLGYSLMLEKRN